MERWDPMIVPTLPVEEPDGAVPSSHRTATSTAADPMDPGDDPMDQRRNDPINLQAKPWPNDPRRCTATNRRGDRCRRWAIRGGTVCLMHGGGMQRKRLARERVLEETDLLASGRGVETRRGSSRYIRMASVERIRADACEIASAQDDAVFACMRLVADQLLLGKTAAQAATAIGVSPRTIDYWSRSDPYFRFLLALDAERLGKDNVDRDSLRMQTVPHPGAQDPKESDTW